MKPSFEFTLYTGNLTLKIYEALNKCKCIFEAGKDHILVYIRPMIVEFLIDLKNPMVWPISQYVYTSMCVCRYVSIYVHMYIMYMWITINVVNTCITCK